MKRKSHKALKRRIPKEPGKSKCAFSFEVDGETVVMKIDCIGSCHGHEMSKDVCWSNLVKAISGSALPDRIILCGKRIMICDKVLVSLLRNASLLVRRIGVRLDEMQRISGNQNSKEIERLMDLMRALLYDIPQLINRDFRSNSRNESNGCHKKEAPPSVEYSTAVEILGKKTVTNLDPLGPDMSERVSG